MQKKKNIFIILTILTIFVLITILGAVSCKSNDKIAKLNGNWNITIIDDTKLNPVDLNNRLPFIKFDTLKKMISGNSGCNDFSADATYAETTIEVRDIVSTLIACENMKIEEQIFKILNNQTVTFNFVGDTLIITNDSGDKITLISEE